MASMMQDERNVHGAEISHSNIWQIIRCAFELHDAGKNSVRELKSTL